MGVATGGSAVKVTVPVGVMVIESVVSVAVNPSPAGAGVLE